MAGRQYSIALLFASILLVCSACAHAGLAAASWPMFHHDLSHRGASPSHDPSPAGTYWTYSVGGGYSSCVVGPDGTIYVGGGTYFYALNGNGTLKWKCSIGGSTRSTPAISDDGTVYIGSSDYRLYAINPGGTVKWTFLTGNQISSSPAIAPDGTVYVGSMDSKLYAVNPDGTQKWSRTFGSQIHVSSPAVGSDGTVYIGSYDGNLYAINSDGTEKWHYGAVEEVLTSPAISPDGSTVYFGVWANNYLYALSTSGALQWRFPVELKHGDTPSSPAVGPDGTIYIGSSSGTLHAVNPAGTEAWRFESGSGIRSSPAVSADGTVYVGCWNGMLHAVNPGGTEKWHFMARNSFYASPAIAADGTVVVGSVDGYVYGGLRGTPSQATPPSNLTAAVLSEMQIRLTWQDHSSDEYGFRVERRLMPGGAYVQVGTVGPNVTAYDDTTTLGSGLTYTYRVCAYQQGGYSAYTNEVIATLPGVGAPTDLVATAVCGTQVDLSWTDRATNELGFRIERMVTPNGPFRQIGTTGPNAGQYNDYSVNPATVYFYRVRAFDATRTSTYSNTAWAMTNGMDFSEIARGNTARKQMALTFDCGTTPILPGILDILREREVYCTFFITGVVAQAVPDSVMQIALDGHVIGNHTYDHPLLTTVSDDEIVRQLSLTDDIIYGISGHRTRPFFRPPGGQRDARVLAAAQSAGFRSVFWTMGGGDFGGWTIQQIIDEVLNNAKNGAVVLCHASVANTQAALPTIIDSLRARGYELVTIPELVAPDVITSPSTEMRAGWNLFSIPCEIANTTPQVVFRGIDLYGRLYRWDPETGSQDLYDPWAPESFGPISPDEGYWLYLDQPTTLHIAGRQPTAARHIKLPQAPPSGGFSMVGYPFNAAQELSGFTVRNSALDPSVTVSLSEAMGMSWMSNRFFGWEAGTQSQYDVGVPEGWPSATQFQPWHGYSLTTDLSQLELVIPVP